jgi:hypothetical protein
MKYRKKPVVVEAVVFPGITIDSLPKLLAFEEWFNGGGGAGRYVGQRLHVLTLEDGPNGEAKHVADPGDWIIRGVKGEFYPCKPDIFAETYEPAGDQTYETDWKPVARAEVPCRKCGVPGHIEFRDLESSCGGYEGVHYRCTNCGKDWWVEGADA